MRDRRSWMGLMLGLVMLAGEPSWAESIGATVSLKQGVRFLAPDGSTVPVAAGTYRLEPVGDDQLRLIADRHSEPRLLQAVTLAFDIRLDRPIAVFIPDEPEASHLVLALPGGKAYDARTWSGERPTRGAAGALSREKLNAVLAALLEAASNSNEPAPPPH